MRNSVTLTINAGTAQPLIPSWVPTKARDLIITPLHGSSAGLGYVLCAPPGAVATKSAQNFVTEIGPATATAPGTIFKLDRTMSGQVPINVEEYQLDGSHTGDTFQCSWELP